MCDCKQHKCKKQWDDKFGMINVCDHEEFDELTWQKDSEQDILDDFTQRMKEFREAREKDLDLRIKIEGVGKDAEVVTNAKGGKQSKAPMAMHLLDPQFLKEWASDKADELEYFDRNDCITVDDADKDNYNCYRAIEFIARFMENTDVDNCSNLQWALDYLCDDPIETITAIARVLQYGASRYKANNWRLIPQEEHINHALIHIIAHLMGDTQDEHIDHALCRLMMAYATEKSEGFQYNSYVNKSS